MTSQTAAAGHGGGGVAAAAAATIRQQPKLEAELKKRSLISSSLRSR